MANLSNDNYIVRPERIIMTVMVSILFGIVILANGNSLCELDNRIDILEAGLEEQKTNDFLEPTVDQPSLADLMEWDERGGCEATDGCWVEPDGGCEHGHVSWLVYLGLI